MKKLPQRILAVLVSFGMFFSSGPAAYCLPVVDSAGSDVNIVEDAGSLTITTADKAIINYSSFDIGSSETVSFVQPSATSVALNRVTGSSRSVIDGSLLANGRIFLVNPNGVLIGSGGIVNAAGFVASSLAISDSDFLSGNYSFTDGASSGAGVHNMGHIIVGQGGYVGLIGKEVVNDGTIDAGYGCVVMAAGDTVSVDFEGDGLVNFAVGGELADVLVRNTGSIHAGGGSILLAASAAANIATNVVNNMGVIEAMSVEGAAGTIRLVAPGAGIRNEGEITTAGRNGAQGGSVELRAGVIANAGVINVSGSEGAAGGVVTLSAGQVTDEGGEIIAEEVVEGEGDGADSGFGSDEITESDEVAAEATGTVVNTGTIEATAGAVDIDSIGDVINEGVINVEDGLLTVDAGGEITNTGSIEGMGADVTLDAEDTISSQGVLRAGNLSEQGAAFKVGGVMEVGTAYVENDDGAVNFTSDLDISGFYADPGNIEIDSGVELTMTGDVIFYADYASSAGNFNVDDGGVATPDPLTPGDGTGAFIMHSGSSIVGAGKNLTLYTSQTATLEDINGVNALTLNRSCTVNPVVYNLSGNISAGSITNNSGYSTFNLNGNNVTTTGLFKNYGTVNLNSGSLNAGGNLISSGGSFSAAANTTISVNGYLRNEGGTFANSGSITVGDKLYNSYSALFTNNAGGTISVTGTLSNEADSSFSNLGIINNTTNLRNSYGGVFDNDGTIILSGILQNTGYAGDVLGIKSCNFINDGNITVAGNFYNSYLGQFTNNTTITTNAELRNEVLADFDNFGTITGSNLKNTFGAQFENKNTGNITVADTLHNIESDIYTGTGNASVFINEGTVNVQDELYNNYGAEFTNQASGVISAATRLVNEADASFINNGQINNNTSQVINRFDSTFTNNGNIQTTGHVLNGIIDVEHPLYQDSSSFTNAGTITVGDRFYNSNSAQFTNNAGASVTSTGRLVNEVGADFTNYGTVNIGNTLYNMKDAVFTGNGTGSQTNVTVNVIGYDGSQLTTQNGAVLNIGNGTRDLLLKDGSSASICGDLYVDELKLEGDADLTVGGNLTVTNALLQYINEDSPVSSSTVTLGGGVDGTYTVDINSGSFWNLTVAGPGTWTAQSDIIVDNDFDITGGTFISNSGLYDFSADDFTITAGTFKRFASGDGTSSTPYEITDVYGLQAMSCDISKYYKLVADIDASVTLNWNNGEGFKPIKGLNPLEETSFHGVFDGDNKTISNLYINRATDFNGLFGRLYQYSPTVTCEVKNLILEDVNITGGNYTGAIAGTLNGVDISKIFVTGWISGSNNTGGIIGRHQNGRITLSSMSGTVSGTKNVGGIAGYLYNSGGAGNIDNTYSISSVNGVENVGGLVGKNEGSSVSCSLAVGPVTGTTNVGAFVGEDVSGIYSYNYYNNEETAAPEIGSNPAEDNTNITGKTTAQLLERLSYEGWDFSSEGCAWQIADIPFEFLWVPNNDIGILSGSGISLSDFYPGDYVVDRILVDGYVENSTDTPSDIFDATFIEINTFADASISRGIGETAGINGQGQAAYYEQLIDWARENGFDYIYIFDEDKEENWTTSAASFIKLRDEYDVNQTRVAGTPKIAVWYKREYPDPLVGPWDIQGIDTIVDVYKDNNSVDLDGLYTFTHWTPSSSLQFKEHLYGRADMDTPTINNGVEFIEKIEPRNGVFAAVTSGNPTLADPYLAEWTNYVTDALNWIDERDLVSGELVNPDRKVQVSLGHEFNGNWYDWGTITELATAEKYAEMYRVFHKIANDKAFELGMASYPTINPEATVSQPMAAMAGGQEGGSVTVALESTSATTGTVTAIPDVSSVSRQAVLSVPAAGSSASPAAMGTVSLDPYIYIDPMLMTSSPLMGGDDTEIDADSLIAQN